MLAVIKTGGKQYKVSPGDKIKIDPPATLRVAMRAGKIDEAKGPASVPSSTKTTADKKATAGKKEITFSEILLLEKQKGLEIGAPFIKGAKVIGKILNQGKSKKVIVFKYRHKTRHKVKRGHRQPFTEIEIVKIESGK